MSEPTRHVVRPREYYIDWLRILAVLLLVPFHTAMISVPWPYHIKNAETSVVLEGFNRFLGIWQMPLLVFMAGAGTWFALGHRTALEYAGERVRRLLVPVAFGMLVIVPPQTYLERLQQGRFHGSFLDFYPHFLDGVYPAGNLTWNHFWFLAYLFVFSLLLPPFFLWARGEARRKRVSRLTSSFRTGSRMEGPATRSWVAATAAAVTALAVSTAEAEEPGRSPATGGDRFPVKIRVDASVASGELRPIWRFFGADEPNYAYMEHGRKLLGELGELAPGRVHFRAHNLLNSGDGTPGLKWGSTGAYREDPEGRPVHDWTILDRIFDAYLECGVRPYAEIGFMPKDLSIRPEPYRHRWAPGAPYDEIYTGWAYPPKDYRRWADLVHAWTQHCVERYGRSEVEQWFWQVWNEPNIGYWRGTPEEFLELNDHALDAVRRALPTARVGGPDTAGHGGEFMRRFLEHCLRGTNHATGKIGTPLDFVSFHAKGAPTIVDGHVRMGIATHLRTIDEGFRLVRSFPELVRTPIVIGESDPEGCAACQGPQLAYRNGTMYSSYTAASFARKLDLAERHGVVLEGALTWAFEFEGQPYFAGFRSLATNGIDKPVLNVFRMFSRMRGRRIEAKSDAEVPLDEILESGVRGRADVAALASLDSRTLCVIVWHYHDDDVPGPGAAVELTVTGLPEVAGDALVEQFRVDEDHGNAHAAWKRLGSPQRPSAEEYRRLEAAGRLAALGPARNLRVANGAIRLEIDLPRQAVSLVVITW